MAAQAQFQILKPAVAGDARGRVTIGTDVLGDRLYQVLINDRGQLLLNPVRILAEDLPEVLPSDASQSVAADEALLEEMVWRLRAAFDPWRIYLFGSRARGDARPDSDYDLMVVLNQIPTDQRTFDLRRKAYRLLRGLDARKDVLVWARSEFDARLHLPVSLPATIIREGRILYEHPMPYE